MSVGEIIRQAFQARSALASSSSGQGTCCGAEDEDASTDQDLDLNFGSLLGASRVNVDRGFVTVGAHVLPAALQVSFDRAVVEWASVPGDILSPEDATSLPVSSYMAQRVGMDQNQGGTGAASVGLPKDGKPAVAAYPRPSAGSTVISGSYARLDR